MLVTRETKTRCNRRKDQCRRFNRATDSVTVRPVVVASRMECRPTSGGRPAYPEYESTDFCGECRRLSACDMVPPRLILCSWFPQPQICEQSPKSIRQKRECPLTD